MLREIIDTMAANSRVFQALGGIAGLSFALGKGLWPIVEARMAPPVIVVHGFRIDPGAPGTTGSGRATVTKNRPCYVIAATILVVDYEGRQHLIENTYARATVPQGRPVVRDFQWTIPADMPTGPVQSVAYELVYGNCTDGQDPRPVKGTAERIGIG